MIIENKNLDKKIKKFEELEETAARLHKEGKKIVLCHGVFDGGVHPGHIQYFSSAKKRGDILIVTVTKDEYVDRGPGRPVIPADLRAETVGSLECVDFVAINPYQTAVETIMRLRPDVYAKGQEFANLSDDTGKIHLEAEAVKKVGGEMYFTPGITFSSSALINNSENFHVYKKEAVEFLRNFKKKNSSEEIIRMLKGLSSLKVLVIGEVIIDEYHYCAPMGKAPKENIITNRFVSGENFLGGAGATANNIANFSRSVDFISLLGSNKKDSSLVLKSLKKNVRPVFFYSDNKPTIKKRRGIDCVSLKKIFAEYFIDDTLINQELENNILNFLEREIGNYDIVVASDYGHGLMTSKIISFLCEKSKFLSANAQTNSANLGFNLIDKYPRADYICIDHFEARLATRNKDDDIKVLCRNIENLGDYKKITITEGHMGSLTYSKNEGYFLTPVFSDRVVDTMGAGDAYLSLTSLCAAKGYKLEIIGFVGNAVGALAVSMIGNRDSINPGLLYKFITTLLK